VILWARSAARGVATSIQALVPERIDA
jgi:hypothetical protein